MGNPTKLFIVEGEQRDFRLTEELIQCFFKGRYDAKIISLPVAQNLYMLYQKLAEDNFDTDIVEILRDNIAVAEKKLRGITRQEIDEVYLFFDYDPQQNNTCTEGPNARERLQMMLDTFDNETENGRLYISYPMVEAVYDYKAGKCEAFSNCFVALDSIKEYKQSSGKDNPAASRKLRIKEWKDILSIFFLRIKCLFELDDLDYHTYQNKISPKSVFTKEQQLVDNNRQVYVLSAFPEFLFDNFKKDFWISNTHLKKYHFDNCPINRQ